MLTTKNTVITHIIEIVPIQQHPLRLPQHSHKPPTCPLTEITPKYTGNYIFFLQVPFESWTVINLEGPYIHAFIQQKLAFFPMKPSSMLTCSWDDSSLQHYANTDTPWIKLTYCITHAHTDILFLCSFFHSSDLHLWQNHPTAFAEQKSHVQMQVYLQKHMYAHIYDHTTMHSQWDSVWHDMKRTPSHPTAIPTCVECIAHRAMVCSDLTLTTADYCRH